MTERAMPENENFKRGLFIGAFNMKSKDARQCFIVVKIGTTGPPSLFCLI